MIDRGSIVLGLNQSMAFFKVLDLQHFVSNLLCHLAQVNDDSGLSVVALLPYFDFEKLIFDRTNTADVAGWSIQLLFLAWRP